MDNDSVDRSSSVRICVVHPFGILSQNVFLLLMGIGLYITIMVLLVVLSAYFSMTETAFASLNHTKIRTLAESGNKRAKLTYKLSEQYDKLISTILIGNNIVNIALASIATFFFTKQLGDIGATISTIVITIVVLIFGEITPKTIANDFPESIAMFSSPLIQFLIWIFLPLNVLFSLWKKLMNKIFKPESKNKMSQEELLTFVDEVEEEGSIDESESDLLKNAIEFSKTTVQDILTHRTKLEALPVDCTKEELDKVFTETMYSRVLIYEDDIDHIIGFVHQKDFYTNSGISSKSIRELLSKVIYIPQVEKISLTLKKLQKNKTHIAVVIDEFGGTYGIVSMEDILEELVGEIWDEHDEIVEYFKKINKNTYLVDTEATYDDFVKFFDIQSDEDYSSIPSFISDNLEKIPEVGDSFEFENLTIKIQKKENACVNKILVIKHEVSQ